MNNILNTVFTRYENIMNESNSMFPAFSHLNVRQREDAVIYGCGMCGELMLPAVNRNFNIVAVTDADSMRWGSAWNGFEILPPREVIKKYSKSLYIVCIDKENCITYAMRELNPHFDLRITSWKTLRTVSRIIGNEQSCFTVAQQTYDDREKISIVYDMLEDGISRQYLKEVVEKRLLLRTSDFMNNQGEYFDNDIYLLNESEVFIDLGGYTGDTLKKFLKVTSGKFQKYYYFEPIPEHINKVADYISKINPEINEKIIIYQKAVSDKSGDCKIAIERRNGFIGAASTITGYISDDYINVQTTTLDDEFKGAVIPTIIKMDVEGAEELVLDGGKNLIVSSKPILEISAYHRISDIWKLPQKAKNWLPNHILVLRVYNGVDLLYYLVPRERAAKHLQSGIGCNV